MSEQKKLNRHDFLSISIWAIGGFIAFSLSLPAIAYIISPALKRETTQTWIRLSSTSKVEIGVPTLFKVKIVRKTGWIVKEEEVSVYVLTENGRDFLVMSNICTHLGCRVRWIDDQGQFFCPCHNAIFDKVGNVVAGPPPKPLDRFVVKVEDDVLFILGG